MLRTIASLKVFPPRLEGGDLQLNGLQRLSDRTGLWHERKVFESDGMMKLYQESGWIFASVNSVHLEMWNNHSITFVGHLGEKTQIHVGRCGCMCFPLFACVPFIWWRPKQSSIQIYTLSIFVPEYGSIALLVFGSPDENYTQLTK